MRTALPIVFAVALITSCDEARDEYSYKLPSPPPTMAPPSVPAQPPTETKGTPTPAVTPGIKGARVFNFVKNAAPPNAPMRKTSAAGLTFDVPEFWQDVTSGAPMRVKEYIVPGLVAGGGQEGELIAFHFGKGQGGSAEDNVSRWIKQLTPEASSAPPEIVTGVVNGLNITAVTVSGTFAPPAMGDTPAPEPLVGFALMGVIVEGGPEGTVFFRLVGPAQTVGASSKPMIWMAASVAPMEEPAPGSATIPEDGHVFAGVHFPTPKDWAFMRPSSSMRVAEFAIPGEKGNSEAVVFAFGPGQGGGAEDNIARWVKQISQPDGSETKSIVEQAKVGSLTVYQVIAEGTYAGASMGGAPSTPAPDTRMHGLIVEGGSGGSVFIRVTGPKAELAAREAEIRKMAEGVQPAP